VTYTLAEKFFLGEKHSTVPRSYLSRVTDLEFPKHRAAELAKKWGKDYWDGDRRTGYGGYHFIPGYWTPLAEQLIAEYNLSSKSRVLDIGCGKAFLLAELASLLPGIQLKGLDASAYAIEHAHALVSSSVEIGSCVALPYEADEFDLAISLNVFHNLISQDLLAALKEISRVSKMSYLVVESYDTELQKENLLYWQLTCEAFLRPEEWKWWFELAGYDRDYEFIFFD